jgi:hypothetical protein
MSYGGRRRAGGEATLSRGELTTKKNQKGRSGWLRRAMRLILSALALQPFSPNVLRVSAPPFMQQQQSPPLRKIQDESELKMALSNIPPLGTALLMCSMRGDQRASKVLSYLVDKCADNELLHRLHWECDADEPAHPMGADPARMPFFIGFDSGGEKVLDFVAQTPSALFYGLENLGGVLDAYAEQESQPQQQSAATPAEVTTAAAASDQRVAALELNVEILEAEVYDLKLQVSKQQAELFGASRKFDALVKRVEELEQGQRIAATQQASSAAAAATFVAANEGRASSGPLSEALDKFLAEAPDEDDDVLDPFAYVLGED